MSDLFDNLYRDGMDAEGQEVKWLEEGLVCRVWTGLEALWVFLGCLGNLEMQLAVLHGFDLVFVYIYYSKIYCYLYRI